MRHPFKLIASLLLACAAVCAHAGARAEAIDSAASCCGAPASGALA